MKKRPVSLGMPVPGGVKRTALLKAYVPESLRDFYKSQAANHPRKTISDVVYEALEQQAAIQIAKQTIGARGANS